MSSGETILVTGATGYIGGRLVPRLLERGLSVRVFVRDPARIAGRPWAGQVELACGDLLDPSSLTAALAGVDRAYYLVHGMYGGSDYEQRDRQAALNFREAAASLRHVIYVGGLLPRDGAASAHLRSRAEVGRLLGETLPVTEFRAGPVIGSGSASFEMVRYLTERLPVMIAPKWVKNAVSPISIRDLLDYLVHALDREPMGVVDLGADPLPFIEMMRQYADCRGYRRRILPVPVLAPALAARWVGLVTPIPNRLAVPLVRGMIRPLLADTARADRLFPEIRPMPYKEAVRLALARTLEHAVETRWSGALHEAPARAELSDWEGTIREVRSIQVGADPAKVFRVLSSIGGERGWPAWDWAWKVRGWIDRIVGGPGLRRGRRHPDELLAGETLDFWRVEEVDPPHRLLLRAEMKMPGLAWLEWKTVPDGQGARLVQTASFIPRGVWGALYWYSLYPLHGRIFSDLVKRIGQMAERDVNPL